MGRYRGLDAEEGWIQRRLAAIERTLTEQAAARRLVVATSFLQGDVNSTDLPTGFTEYLLSPFFVPAGYTSAIVNVFVSAGTTALGAAADSANVGVQPRINGFGGPALSNGRSGPGALSVNSGFAKKVSVTGGLTVSLYAYSAGTAGLQVGSGNVHLSATAIFVRD